MASNTAAFCNKLPTPLEAAAAALNLFPPCSHLHASTRQLHPYASTRQPLFMRYPPDANRSGLNAAIRGSRWMTALRICFSLLSL